MNELADELARTRMVLEGGHDEAGDRLLSVEGRARQELLNRGQGSFLGRVFGFDPATLVVIYQLVLLVLELVRQLRQIRRPS